MTSKTRLLGRSAIIWGRTEGIWIRQITQSMRHCYLTGLLQKFEPITFISNQLQEQRIREHYETESSRTKEKK